MLLKEPHVEKRIPALREFVRDHPLGTITTAISSPDHPFLQTTHIPWVLDVNNDSDESELGVLRGHMARQNPQAKVMMEDAQTNPSSSKTSDGGVELETEVLVLFTSSVHHYVTPKFYTDTKPATGKVVPTWDYSAVQAYGKVVVYFGNTDETSAYLSQQVDDLSRHAEQDVMGYDKPWKVSDAPESYTNVLKKNIIGVKVELTRLEGKFKMSQEMNAKDRAGVAKGFDNLQTDLGKQMAQTVRNREQLL